MLKISWIRRIFPSVDISRTIDFILAIAKIILYCGNGLNNTKYFTWPSRFSKSFTFSLLMIEFVFSIIRAYGFVAVSQHFAMSLFYILFSSSQFLLFLCLTFHNFQVWKMCFCLACCAAEASKSKMCVGVVLVDALANTFYSITTYQLVTSCFKTGFRKMITIPVESWIRMQWIHSFNFLSNYCYMR